MRGKGTSKCTQLSYTRITPAYAGKRQMVLVVLDCSRDHPRVCGEKAESYDTLISYTGSPPRMRGKETVLLERFCETGITPAYAGKSRRGLLRRTAARDHPRVCGEKLSCPARARHHKGSPPRMRGKVVRRNSTHPGSRDHPRVCGEKYDVSFYFLLMLGSPPRMRGKVLISHSSAYDSRITPAYAGKRAAITCRA